MIYFLFGVVFIGLFFVLGGFLLLVCGVIGYMVFKVLVLLLLDVYVLDMVCNIGVDYVWMCFWGLVGFVVVIFVGGIFVIGVMFWFILVFIGLLVILIGVVVMGLFK